MKNVFATKEKQARVRPAAHVQHKQHGSERPEINLKSGGAQDDQLQPFVSSREYEAEYLSQHGKSRLPYEGSTVQAQGCAPDSCGISFAFNRAQAIQGPYEYGDSTETGVYVEIEANYNLADCGPCQRLRWIQVLREITVSSQNSNNIVTHQPTNITRRRRSGSNSSTAVSGSRGWRIDSLLPEAGQQHTKREKLVKNPYYENQPGYDHRTGTPDQTAILRDAPATVEENHGKEFWSFLVCENPAAQQNTVIGGVNWGYMVRPSITLASGQETGPRLELYPSAPVAICGANQQLRDADSRWTALGNTPSRISYPSIGP